MTDATDRSEDREYVVSSTACTSVSVYSIDEMLDEVNAQIAYLEMLNDGQPHEVSVTSHPVPSEEVDIA